MLSTKHEAHIEHNQTHPQITLPARDNPFSTRLHAIVDRTRTMHRGVYWPQLYLVRDDGGSRGGGGSGDVALRTWTMDMFMLNRAPAVACDAQGEGPFVFISLRLTSELTGIGVVDVSVVASIHERGEMEGRWGDDVPWGKDMDMDMEVERSSCVLYRRRQCQDGSSALSF
jgi:hypothetical protein